MKQEPEHIPRDNTALCEFVRLQPPVPLKSVPELRLEMLAHYKNMAKLDVGYARWCCGSLQRANPGVHTGLLAELDAWLAEQGIEKPLPFGRWFAKLRGVEDGE